MSRQSLFKLIAILVGTFLSLVLAEVVYRVYYFANYADMKDIRVGTRKPVVSPDVDLKLGEIIRLSAHQDIVYELIPSSKYRFQNVLVETNAAGFKDREYPSAKQPKTVRIVGLGDSVMFGWGVPESDCYLTKLEDALNQSGDIPFEVINTAVPGYNTVMEVATLEQKMDLGTVDLVIINFVGNDLDLPNFIRKKPAYFGTKKSFILQRFEENDGMDKDLREAPLNESYTGYVQDPDKVPAEYRHLVGEEAYINAMDRLKELQDKHGFKVIVLSNNPMDAAPAFVLETCEKLGFEMVNIMPYWAKYKDANPDAVWQLSEADSHPSTLGHSVIAEALKEKVLASR